MCAVECKLKTRKVSTRCSLFPLRPYKNMAASLGNAQQYPCHLFCHVLLVMLPICFHLYKLGHSSHIVHSCAGWS